MHTRITGIFCPFIIPQKVEKQHIKRNAFTLKS